MTIPQQAIDLIKEFEGFRESTYLDSVGVPTIGYGTTAAAGLGIVPVPGMTISEKQAERYLVKGIEKFAREIEPHVKRKPSDNEWSAMLSLAYNIGSPRFIKSSVLRFHNAGETMRAADAFLLWDKAGGQVLRGLVRRRQRERTLYLTPDQKTPWGGILAALWGILKRLFGK
jgi:GH24 family phage-related lysozyme (muramidase)